MSRKNSLEQKKIRREERAMNALLQEEKYQNGIKGLKELYKQFYPNFNYKGRPVDEQRIIRMLVSRIGQAETDKFLESVRKEKK